MKILIVSHNPLSTNQNMGKTMLSLFSEFQSNEICQLYVYPSLPNTIKCNSYFRITDLDVLKGMFLRKVNSTTVMPVSREEKQTVSSMYGSIKNRKHYRELVRDYVWLLSPWYNKALKDWLANEKPTHVFIAPGRGKFLYNIALRISKDFQIPIISYFCDDYYGLNRQRGILGLIWQLSLKGKIKNLIAHSVSVVTISKEMEEAYRGTFFCNTKTIMTGSNRKNGSICVNSKRLSSITYMGNIGLNRYISIIEVARTLEAVSDNYGLCYLDIYTGSISPDIKTKLQECKQIRIHSFVIGEEYEKVFNNAEAFLHVEAFDTQSIDRVKYSISTKIPDVLSSGKPLFAYGPEGIASISHLLKNRCATVATKPDELKKRLIEFIMSYEERLSIVLKALETADKYHDSSKSSKELKELFKIYS